MKMTLKLIVGLVFIFFVLSSYNYADTLADCEISKATQLFNQTNPPIPQVKDILNKCDQVAPNNVYVLTLHGLLARKESQSNGNYQDAINWLQKAVAVASPDNNLPSLELAATYYWSKQYDKANEIYSRLLAKNPNLRPALFGSAYVGIAQNNLIYPTATFLKLLQQNPNDVEALNGLGRIKLMQGHIPEAKSNFEKALQLSPNNRDALIGLAQANKIVTVEQTNNAAGLSPINQATKGTAQTNHATSLSSTNHTTGVVQSTRAVDQPPTNATQPSPQTSTVSASCQVNEGLTLINQVSPPLSKVKVILAQCDQTGPNNVQVLLLHGLLARKEGLATKHFAPAINWFQKAVAVATPDNNAPALELATTYEWANQPGNANKIYNQILAKDPHSRPALLGSANVAIAQNRLSYAARIYQNFLKQNPSDVDALNGLGRVELAQHRYANAIRYFRKVLRIAPNNADARIGIKQATIAAATPKASPPSNCHVDEGLKLVNTNNPPFNRIATILEKCDKETPNDVNVLLLHGLLARKEGMRTHCYTTAIYWLQKATAVAAPDNFAPELELATTYEWANLPERAEVLYCDVLRKDPNNRAALLGLASVSRAQYNFRKAMIIYNSFLEKNPNDVDALIGVASVHLANYRFECACLYYKKVQLIQPNNTDLINGLYMLNNVTRYRMTLYQGVYRQEIKSYSTGIDFVENLNATDELRLLLIHNSNEIQFGFLNTPAFLPKNSALVGFHRQYHDRYGWGGYIDFRRHTNQGNEYHVSVDGNVYLLPRFQVFGGIQESLPTPFNYQIYWLGGTMFTDFPFNITFTSYQGIQELPDDKIIHSPAYVLDLNKEYPNRLYYDLGAGYLPSETNPWTAHANFVIPTFKNQAFEAWYEYYWFNNSYYGGLGWRFYW